LQGLSPDYPLGSPETRPAAMSEKAQADDIFELYDLRVDVICPPGKRIVCGAKSGDHFFLHGEMLYLPPGQGISIYVLSMYYAIYDRIESITNINIL
jgi:hypothetical protein